MIRQLNHFKLIVETPGMLTIEEYRANSFYDKEPETLAWINTFEAKPDGVFFDVGANIGVYSLYAASLYPDMKIYAFEPYLPNYMRLLQNIELNGFKNITALPIAIGLKYSADILYLKYDEVGSSGGQIREPIDEHGKEFKPVRIQPIITIPMLIAANFLSNQDPHFVKVDVDGKEFDVISSMGILLRTKEQDNLQSILVEINRDITPVHKFDELLGRYNLIPNDEINNLPNHSNQRRGGNPINVVYKRGDKNV